MDEWIDGYIRLVSRQTDGWTEKWMDGWKDR